MVQEIRRVEAEKYAEVSYVIDPGMAEAQGRDLGSLLLDRRCHSCRERIEGEEFIPSVEQQMKEIARFVETANELVPTLDAMDEAIAKEVASENAENARNIGRGKRTAFRVAHAKEWGEVILREFQQVVTDGLALPGDKRPAEAGTEWPAPED